MKASELRDLSFDELTEKEREFKEEMFNLRFQHATGQLENTAMLKALRRNVARMESVLGEKREAVK